MLYNSRKAGDNLHPVFLIISLHNCFTENNHEAQIFRRHFCFFLPIFSCRQKKLSSKQASVYILMPLNFTVVKMHFKHDLFSILCKTPYNVCNLDLILFFPISLLCTRANLQSFEKVPICAENAPVFLLALLQTFSLSCRSNQGSHFFLCAK